MHKQLPYRLGVGAVLLNTDGKVFCAMRIDNPNPAWQMPQGGIDKYEAPSRAIYRELLEEIGTNKAAIAASSRSWIDYDLPSDLVGKVWKGKYRGQRQKWYLMQFQGTDRDINIETEHPEFRAWMWMDYKEMIEKIVPFKKELYLEIGKEFSLI
jgi:NTP pyrophosphohydrolases including oxidative damage repair enzymes